MVTRRCWDGSLPTTEQSHFIAFFCLLPVSACLLLLRAPGSTALHPIGCTSEVQHIA